MLRKILGFTLVAYAIALFTPADALAWGCGSWSRSGSASFTGRYGNTYSRSWSGSGSGYRYGGYHYGGWGGIIMAVTTVAAEGIMRPGFVRAVTSPGMRLESIIPNTDLPGLVLYLGTGFRSLTRLVMGIAASMRSHHHP
jgi:hypothetical protein